ncbi:unnamed protein product [Phytomonas sp. EM1]|nr:unnamed protein product [Phytomonas sp. EM1]|eukprot:CCW62349.1 unnamed protein product [Phytomonas sp. isolate EM1]
MPRKETKLKRTSPRSPSRSATPFSDYFTKPGSSRRRKITSGNRVPSSRRRRKGSAKGSTKGHARGGGRSEGRLSPSRELRSPALEGGDPSGEPNVEDARGGVEGDAPPPVSRPRVLQQLADRLAHSLEALRESLAEKEQCLAALEEQKRAAEFQISNVFQRRPTSPPNLNRIRQEKVQLETEIEKTNHTIRELIALSNRLDQIRQHRTKSLGSAKKKLEMEIKELEIEKQMNASIIREGFVNRINLLRRYWPWRQLLELGDTTVASTFEEELKRGPRYRNVGLQNNVQSDYLEQQIKWLETLQTRESAFQNRLWQLEKFVEDLYDINDMIEEALLCKVCGLLYDDPVLFWPCGHSFCHDCFQSLAIAPSLYRCPICGSIDSEGFVHNLLLGDTVAKWMFKDLGFNGLQAPLSSIRIHLMRFQKTHSDSKLVKLKQILKEQTFKESQGGASDSNDITISYRTY